MNSLGFEALHKLQDSPSLVAPPPRATPPGIRDGGSGSPPRATAQAQLAKPEWRAAPGRPRRWGAIRRSYLAIVESGLAALGPAFRLGFEASSDAVPAALVFDDVPGPSTA